MSSSSCYVCSVTGEALVSVGCEHVVCLECLSNQNTEDCVRCDTLKRRRESTPPPSHLPVNIVSTPPPSVPLSEILHTEVAARATPIESRARPTITSTYENDLELARRLVEEEEQRLRQPGPTTLHSSTTTAPIDPDLEFAMRLQEEENRASQQQRSVSITP
eukprot:PhF_6_TR31215/c0_g1_i1/m.45765